MAVYHCSEECGLRQGSSPHQGFVSSKAMLPAGRCILFRQGDAEQASCRPAYLEAETR